MDFTDLTVLNIFAHPDDESFLVAGVSAALMERGAHVALVSATRGEVGQISDASNATAETLGEVRERELVAAMNEIGITDVRFLGFRDSGMDGSDDNRHADALANSTTDEVARRIVAIIEVLNPDVLVTFSPEGIYLHPDHVAAHRASVRAVELLEEKASEAVPQFVYFATTPREWIQLLRDSPGNPFADEPEERVAQMGVPIEQITHIIDVSGYLDRKQSALRQHRTQFGDVDPLSELPAEVREQVLCQEHFVLSSLSTGSAPDPLSALHDALKQAD